LIRERFQSEQYFIKNISKFEMASRTTRVMNLKTDTTVKLQFVTKIFFKLSKYDTNIEDYDNYIKESNKYLSLCHAVIIVYSVTKKQSFFNAIGRWYHLVKKRQGNYTIFFVGMKADQEKLRTVSTKDGEVRILFFKFSLSESFTTKRNAFL
jgi:GTPase SAR1 family protein